MKKLIIWLKIFLLGIFVAAFIILNIFLASAFILILAIIASIGIMYIFYDIWLNELDNIP